MRLVNIAAIFLLFAALAYWFADSRPTPVKLPPPTVALASPQVLTSPSPTQLPPARKGFKAEHDQNAMHELLARFNTGSFVQAVQLADKFALDTTLSSDFQLWLREQMPVLLISAGWLLLKAEDCDGAVLYLTRAEGYARSAETTQGLAYCFKKSGAVASADEQFQAFFKFRPDDINMRLLYADLLETEGRFGEAVNLLEEASTQQPKADGAHDELASAISKRLKAMRARASEGRQQMVESSRYFALTYRIGEHQELAPIVLQTLEQAAEEFVEDFGFYEPRMPIEVILYSSTSFKDASGGPGWAEGIFDGRMRIPVRPLSRDMRANVSQNAQLAVALRHELFHALSSLSTGGMGFPPG